MPKTPTIDFVGTAKTVKGGVIIECGKCGWKRTAKTTPTSHEEAVKKGHALLDEHYLSFHASMEPLG